MNSSIYRFTAASPRFLLSWLFLELLPHKLATRGLAFLWIQQESKHNGPSLWTSCRPGWTRVGHHSQSNVHYLLNEWIEQANMSTWVNVAIKDPQLHGKPISMFRTACSAFSHSHYWNINNVFINSACNCLENPDELQRPVHSVREEYAHSQAVSTMNRMPRPLPHKQKKQPRPQYIFKNF